MVYKRIKGKRVKFVDAYYCNKLQMKIVQKIRFCGEDAPDLCFGCRFRKPAQDIQVSQ